MAGRYRFEFGGAPFSVDIDDDVSGYATTTAPPNVRTIEGTWTTWHVSVPDRTARGVAGVRLVRSVGADGGPHPSDNLSPEESAAHGYMAMVAAPTGNPTYLPGVGPVDGGEVYQIPGGWGVVSHFYTYEEWGQMTANWDARARSQGGQA